MSWGSRHQTLPGRSLGKSLRVIEGGMFSPAKLLFIVKWFKRCRTPSPCCGEVTALLGKLAAGWGALPGPAPSPDTLSLLTGRHPRSQSLGKMQGTSGQGCSTLLPRARAGNGGPAELGCLLPDPPQPHPSPLPAAGQRPPVPAGCSAPPSFLIPLPAAPRPHPSSCS